MNDLLANARDRRDSVEQGPHNPLQSLCDHHLWFLNNRVELISPSLMSPFSPHQLMNDIFTGLLTSLKSRDEPGKFEGREYERRETHLENTLNFIYLTSLLRTNITSSIVVYRSVDLSLAIGSTYVEPLPFSCSWSLEFCRVWKTNNAVLRIEVTDSFVIASYPENLIIRSPELNPEQKEVVVAPARMRISSSSIYQGCPILHAIPTFLSVEEIEEIYENPVNYSTIEFPVATPITTSNELPDALQAYIVKLIDYYRRKRPDDDSYTSAQNFLAVLTTGIETTLQEAQESGHSPCEETYELIADDLIDRLDGLNFMFPYQSVSTAFDVLVYIPEPYGCSRSLVFPDNGNEYTTVLPMLARSTPNAVYRNPLVVPYSALSLNYNITTNSINDPEWVVLPITIIPEQNYYRGHLRDNYNQFVMKYRGF